MEGERADGFSGTRRAKSGEPVPTTADCNRGVWVWWGPDGTQVDKGVYINGKRKGDAEERRKAEDAGAPTPVIAARPVERQVSGQVAGQIAQSEAAAPRRTPGKRAGQGRSPFVANRFQRSAERVPLMSTERLMTKSGESRPVVRNFIQRDPVNGAPPSEQTEVRIAYDAKTLYVAARLFDRTPKSIMTGLGRRDTLPQSDTFTLFLDPLDTGSSGYFFRVNASALKEDGLVFRAGETDNSWDAVWQARTSIDGGGWNVEMAIPLSSIRYQQRRTQRWGLAFETQVATKR